MANTILQIEDDEDILEISRIAIELTPTVVSYHAATGQAGLHMLKRVKPNVILLDVNDAGHGWARNNSLHPCQRICLGSCDILDRPRPS